MKAFYILVAIALIGLGAGVVDVLRHNEPTSTDTRAIPQIELPFRHFIAATGIVEAASKNIVIGAPVSGVVKEVAVKNGQKVHKGALLFTLDDTLLRQKIAIAESQKIALRARVQMEQEQFALLQSLRKTAAHMVTQEKFLRQKEKRDLARKALEALQRKIEVMQQQRDNYKILAPITGVVLHAQLSPGSYFQKNDPERMLVLGSDILNLKASINEYDLWRFRPDAKAIAFVRGHPELKIEAKYLYTVPLVERKIDLTGSATEQTDTRVLRVVYRLGADRHFPLYAGQQMDLFIETER